MGLRVVRKAAAATTLAPLALTNEPTVTPNLAAPVTVTAGASFAFGAWAQLTASLGSNANGYLLLAIHLQPGTNVTYLVEIGTGAIGSEVGKYQVPDVEQSSAGDYSRDWLPFPIVIPASTRVAARAANNQALTEPINVYIVTVPLAVAATLV